MSTITDGRAHRYMTPLEKLLGLLWGIGLIVIPLVYIVTPWLDFADHRLPAWVGALGTAIYAAALALQWKARTDLGHNLTATAATQEGQSLVTGGAYRYIRHPIFAGFWLQAIAQAMLLHNWIAGFAGLALLLPIYMYRVHLEEQNMLARFGDEYRAFKERTGRLIPILWR